MRIGFAATFIEGFSGGRFHAFALGAELAAQGHEVVFVCNRVPGFLDKLPPIPGRELVRFEKLRFNLLRPPNPLIFDLWIIVQERSLNGRFFCPVFENARRHGTPMLLLTYETPNWQEAVLGTLARDSLDAMTVETMRLGAQCLSSTREGREWARRWFSQVPGEYFHVLNPPILAGCYPEPAVRDPDLIVAFVRRTSPHKGFQTILRLLTRELAGRRVVLVDGHGISLEVQAYADQLADRAGIQVELRSGIADAEKFALIKSARALLFPSLFEGFGLPPGEALYWGTPVICYDLPVLREVYGEAPRFAPWGDEEAFAAEVHRELAREPVFEPAREARHVGDFGRWREEVRAMLAHVVEQWCAPPPLPNVKSGAVPPVVIFDQLGNWNKDDVAAAAGLATSQCAIIGFEEEVFHQSRLEHLQQAIVPGEVILPAGRRSEGLREKLLLALEETDSELVYLTEDLLVCPAEVIRETAAMVRETDVRAAIIPTVVHFQADGARCYRAINGSVVGTCGVFRRDFLIECLKRNDSPGCRSQPVLDVCFLVLASGGRIVSSAARAERLPPRDAELGFDLLPGGAGTWHELWRQQRGIRDLIEPLPCRDADDRNEIEFLAMFRRKTIQVLADHAQRRVSRVLVTEMVRELTGYCRVWREAFDGERPLQTMHRISGNYLRFGRCFLTDRHMEIFLESALCSMNTDKPLSALFDDADRRAMIGPMAMEYGRLAALKATFKIA